MDYNAQPQAEESYAQSQAWNESESEAIPASWQEQPTDDAFELEVKYNKEPRKLSREQAVEYAQKGMNYDKVYGELEGLKNDEGIRWFVDYAKSLGVRPADLAAKWGPELSQQVIGEYAEAHDISYEEAEKQIERDAKLSTLETEVAGFRERLSIEDDIKTFFDRHPDITADKIPDEVLEAAREGTMSLSAAYDAYERIAEKEYISELERMIGIKSTNDTNESSSMGPVTGGGTYDPEITEETIKNMSQRDLERNHNKIWSFLTGGRKG